MDDRPDHAQHLVTGLRADRERLRWMLQPSAKLLRYFPAARKDESDGQRRFRGGDPLVPGGVEVNRFLREGTESAGQPEVHYGGRPEPCLKVVYIENVHVAPYALGPTGGGPSALV